MNKTLTFLKNKKGATMVEYALLLVAVLLLAAGAYRALGPTVGAAATHANGAIQ